MYEVFFIIMSLIMILAPEFLWWWRYKDIKGAEPSEWSIKESRILGVIILIITIISIIF